MLIIYKTIVKNFVNCITTYLAENNFICRSLLAEILK